MKDKKLLKQLFESLHNSLYRTYGVKLTKKEALKVVTDAIEAKRQRHLKDALTDHSISELQTLLEVIREHKA